VKMHGSSQLIFFICCFSTTIQLKSTRFSLMHDASTMIIKKWMQKMKVKYTMIDFYSFGQMCVILRGLYSKGIDF